MSNRESKKDITTAFELAANSNVDTTYHDTLTRNLQRTDSAYYDEHKSDAPLLQHAMHKFAPLAHRFKFTSRHTSSGYAVAPRHDLILNSILRWLVPVSATMHLVKFSVVLMVLCGMLKCTVFRVISSWQLTLIVGVLAHDWMVLVLSKHFWKSQVPLDESSLTRIQASPHACSITTL